MTTIPVRYGGHSSEGKVLSLLSKSVDLLPEAKLVERVQGDGCSLPPYPPPPPSSPPAPVILTATCKEKPCAVVGYATSWNEDRAFRRSRYVIMAQL